MRYEIKGEGLPVVEVFLNRGEAVKCEGGAMSWMSPSLKMKTTAGGGFARLFSGEKIFSNIYTAEEDDGYIAFASSFPGSIKAVEIHPGQEVICQKSAFLAASSGVDFSIFFQKKVGAGLFGGEGFIMQKFSGDGVAFIEIDGTAIEKTLDVNEKLIVDTGYVAMMDASVQMDIQSVKGVGNVLFGGEGLFNTVLTGPGKVILQTMPIPAVANVISKYIPSNKN